MHHFKSILWETIEDIGIVTLNRPEQYNAFNDSMAEELISVIEGLNKQDAVRALVITGAGDKAFSAGGDFGKETAMGWAKETNSPEVFMRGYRDTVPRIVCGLQNLNVPTIAAINGVAVGLGGDMALACDVRIACEKTRLGSVWIKRGLIPAAGSFWLLPRIVGLGRAADIMFSGRFIEAEEGERMGLYNKVVPLASLKIEAMRLAQTYTENPPIAIKLTKMMLYRGLNMEFRAGLDMAGAVQAVAHTTEDHTESVNAWREKRKPVYRGK